MRQFEKIKSELIEWAKYRGSLLHQRPTNVKLVSMAVNTLTPKAVRILEIEYCCEGPQKTKAATLNISRQAYSARLRWIHEQLSFTLWGYVDLTDWNIPSVMTI